VIAGRSGRSQPDELDLGAGFAAKQNLVIGVATDIYELTGCA